MDWRWDALPAPVAERRARLVLARRFADRGMAALAEELAVAAGPEPEAAAVPCKGRILLTSYGFNDPGGGTVPAGDASIAGAYLGLPRNARSVNVTARAIIADLPLPAVPVTISD